jgi:ABC-type branched-subunit amino acid transport system substrate-binding protein
MSEPRPRRSRYARSLRYLAGIALIGLVAAACGSSGTSSSASAPGVSANTITLGSHTPLTGIAASSGYSEIAPAVKAMFQYINAKGGVNGRTINYDYEDDAYNPSQTATVVRKLVLQNNVFGILNGLGTPTHQQVQSFLNTEKVPDLFVASGCVCWNDTAKYPYTTGYQTNYEIEGRILGNYINNNFKGQKVGYLLQNDDVGQGGAAGLNQEIPASDVVSKQSYDVSSLAGPLTNQMSALQAAGAKVVVLFSIPAATALAMLAAAQIGYHPQYVASSINADKGSLAKLLSSFSKGAAGESLLNGFVTAGYLVSYSDTSNPWVQLFKKVHDQYDTANPFDFNALYGMSVGYTFYQLLQKTGKNVTRSSIMNALNSANLSGPGLLPLTFSSSNHRGYEGEQMARFDSTGVTAFGPVYKTLESGPITTYTGGQPNPPAGF